MRKLALALLGTGALAIGAISAAAAADLKAPVGKAPVAQVHSWTGFYLGVHAGYSWADGTIEHSSTDGLFGGPLGAIAVGAIPGSITHRMDGFIGGGQAGYNVQSGQFVYGIEADISYTDLRGSSTVSTNAFQFFYPPLTTTQSTRLEWFGTARMRVGFLASPAWLIYATGGVAFGGAKASTVVTIPTGCFGNALCSAGSASDTLAGWTIGGGFEHAVGPRWTIRLEYLYFDLGSLSYNVLPTEPPFLGCGCVGMQSRASFDGHILRGAVNLRF